MLQKLACIAAFGAALRRSDGPSALRQISEGQMPVYTGFHRIITCNLRRRLHNETALSI
jgi:hypothetical protein